MSKQPERDSLSPEIRWTVGCLVSAAALLGIAILVLLVALALEPPAWAQVLAGVGLALGGAGFAWLVANALGQAKGDQSREASVRPVSPDRTGSSGGSVGD